LVAVVVTMLELLMKTAEKMGAGVVVFKPLGL